MVLRKNTECIGTTLPIASTDNRLLFRLFVEYSLMGESPGLLLWESGAGAAIAAGLCGMAPNIGRPG